MAAAPGRCDTIAVGLPGPWADTANRMGWIPVEADITTPEGVERLAARLVQDRVRVFHPLVAMPTASILPSTARLLAALGRAEVRLERLVLGGSACVWRRRAHRWGVGDDSPIGPLMARRARAYMAAETLAAQVAGRALIRLRAAPIWDAPERGLACRLGKGWVPEPKEGRAVLDPLCLSDFARAASAALQALEAHGAILGLPGPRALSARTLALAAGARIVPAPTGISEALGALHLFGWDRDTAITMAWSLTLGGAGARRLLAWEATDVLTLDGKKPTAA